MLTALLAPMREMSPENDELKKSTQLVDLENNDPQSILLTDNLTKVNENGSLIDFFFREGKQGPAGAQGEPILQGITIREKKASESWPPSSRAPSRP